MEGNNLFKALMSTIKNNFVKNNVEVLFWRFSNNQIKTIKSYEDISNNTSETNDMDIHSAISQYIHPNDQTKIKNILSDLIQGSEKNSVLFRMVIDQKVIHIRATFERVMDDLGNNLGLLILATDCTNELKEMKETQYQRLKNELIYTMNMMSVEHIPEIIRMFLENALIITESKIGCMYHYDKIQRSFVSFCCSNRFLPDEDGFNEDVENAFSDTHFLDEALTQKQIIIVNEGTSLVFTKYMVIPVLIMEEIASVLVVSNKEDFYTSNDARSIKSSLEEVYRVIQLKENEKIASINREKFQQTFEKAPLGISFISLEGDFIRANKKYCEILGYTEKEMVTMDFAQLTYIDDVDENVRLHNALKNDDIDQYSYEKRYIRADQSLVWVKVTANKVKEEVSKDVYIINVAEDITELEQYRSRLEELVNVKTNEIIRIEEELKLFFNTTLDMLCIANFNGYFTRISTTWNKTLGWSEEELMSQPYINFIHPEDIKQTKLVFKELLQGTNLMNFKNRFICKDGTYKWIDWNSTALLERKLVIAAARDITKQKEIEDALIEAKQEAELAFVAKSEFLANISHEIRTPLNSVIGYAELLEGHLKNPNYISYVKGISTSGRILLSLINDILDLSKLEASKMTLKRDWVNIRDFILNIEKVFTFSAQSKHIDLLIEIDQRLPRYIYMDEIRVRQVLINLLGNGIKFTHKGYVQLKVTFEQETRLEDLNHLVFIVEDTGIGIEENNLESIFEVFTQQKSIEQKYGGSGLGLAICKKLLNIMNGEVFVSSQLGKGSTFTVKINKVRFNEFRNAHVPEPQHYDLSKIEEGIKGDQSFNLNLIDQLVQSKSALKMNLIKQIAKDLIQFGTDHQLEDIRLIAQQLMKAITDNDLEQCNSIINLLKQLLIKREIVNDEKFL